VIYAIKWGVLKIIPLAFSSQNHQLQPVPSFWFPSSLRPLRLYISKSQYTIWTIKRKFYYFSSFSTKNFSIFVVVLLVETKKENRKMSSASRAWAVAASMAAVEALKDQGFCRWNYTIRSLHHHAKNQVKSISQTKKLSSPASTVISRKVRENQKAKQSEESLRKVMYLSCWGPY
jgi:hypothetical protein